MYWIENVMTKEEISSKALQKKLISLNHPHEISSHVLVECNLCFSLWPLLSAPTLRIDIRPVNIFLHLNSICLKSSHLSLWLLINIYGVSNTQNDNLRKECSWERRLGLWAFIIIITTVNFGWLQRVSNQRRWPRLKRWIGLNMLSWTHP